MVAAWIEWANGAAGLWAEAMVRAAWQGGVALLVAWGLCETVARKSGRVQSWLWRLGYAKVVICLLGVAPVALAVLPAREAMRGEAAGGTGRGTMVEMGEMPGAVRIEDGDSGAAGIAGMAGLEVAREIAQGIRPGDDGVSGAARPLRWEVVAMLGWAVGMCVVVGTIVRAWRGSRQLSRGEGAGEEMDGILRQLAGGMGVRRLPRAVRAWRGSRQLSRGEGAGEEMDGILRQLAGGMGVRRLPRAVRAQGMASPVLVGLWRPVIVVPEDWVERSGRKEVRAVLAHELAHVQRGDLWWNWLCVAVGVVLWWHPLVWIARRRWMLAQEMACDERALGATGVAAGAYGRMLVELVAEARGGARGRRQVIGVGVADCAGTLKRRLIAMKTKTRWTKRRAAMAACGVAVVGVMGLVPWKVVAQEGGLAPGTGSATGASIQPATPLPGVRRGDGGHDASFQPPTAAARSPTTLVQRWGIGIADDTPVLVGVMNDGKGYAAYLEVTERDGRTRIVQVRKGETLAWDGSVVQEVTMNELRLSDGRQAKEVVSIGHNLRNEPVERTRTGFVTQTADAPAGGAEGVDPRMRSWRAAQGEGGAVPLATRPAERHYRAVLRSPMVELRSPVDGVLVEVMRKPGDRVRKGEVIFRFQNREVELAAEVSRTRVALAETKLRRVAGPGSQQERAEYEMAVQAERRILEADLQKQSDLQVVAPLDGVVTASDTTPGGFLTRGTVLTTLVNTAEIHAAFNVPADDLGKLRVGQRVTFGGTGASAAGEITYIDPRIDTATGTGTVRATLRQQGEALKPGMVGQVTLAAE
jgi:biotin carboxyl carrier protein